MKWFGNFLVGSNSNNNGVVDDHGEHSDTAVLPPSSGHHQQQQQRRRRSTSSSKPTKSWNSRADNYHQSRNHDSDTNKFHMDELYLSDDDDDWGMSTGFSTPYNNNHKSNSLRHNPTTTNNTNHQFSVHNDHDPDDDDDYDDYDEYDDEDAEYGYEQQRRRRRRRGRQHKYYYGHRSSSSSSSAFWDQISMHDESLRSADHNNNNERDVALRGNIIEDKFNDRRQRRSSSRAGASTAEEDVQEDIRSLEQDSLGGGGGEEEDLDNISSTSSKKEEVANAYRDYLKSIRDGGFESYLDNTIATTTTTKEGKNPNNIDEDGALERVLDMEEERASGSLYRDLYGVHDMRGVTSSPYSEWRAKAKALLRQEEILDKNSRMTGSGKSALSSPSRKILDRFRRKRSAGRGGAVGHNRLHKQSSNEYAGENVGHVDGYDTGIFSKFCRYRVAMFRHPLFRGICVLLSVILAFGVGISYYMRTSSHEANTSSTLEVAGGATEATEQNNTSQGSNSRPSDAILNALSTFEPVWFDRRTGWEGITFMDAVHFCASRKDRVPCPYEIYCNKDDGTPYDGIRPGGEQWAAISNGANQWVQVGEMFTCQRYTDLHDHKKPEWGITGVSSEHEHGAGGITQNIMCCMDVYRIGSLDPFTQWGKNPKMDNVEEDSTKETTDSASVNVEDTDREENPNKGNVAAASDNIAEQKQEKAVIAAFQPVWFSSTHGWSGKSYEDAIVFCESFNHMVLCPYAAYCPNGRAHSPLPGSMVSENEGEQWAPANGPMNTWVQVGTVGGDKSTRCTLHQEMLGERPAWGIDGTRSEVKHHILCCLM